MTSKVKVEGDSAGNIIVPSKNNPEYGSIKVTQKRIIIDDNGFGRPKVVTALVHGTIDHLKSFEWKAGKELDGKIIFKESLTPFNKKNPEKNYKVAGKTGIVCCIDGQPMYHKTFYTENLTAKDAFILDEEGNIMKHDNT